MAVPLYVPPGEINVGRALFHDFVHEEFEQQGLDDAAVIDNSNEDIVREHMAMAQNLLNAEADGLGAGVPNIVLRTIGSDLRNLANDFARSPQRGEVRRHAYRVDLRSLTYEGFLTLLQEVFRHGINVYNIVALFYFVSDILIRAVKVELARIGINLFRWALQYISENVCRWVYEHGGWEKVIKQVMRGRNVAYVALGVLGVVAVWGIYKGIKS
uniref:Apoptosis regulator Bcl-2 n=1 Tax=Parasteatoda tepidariorum TaxID=114398 RepID=A0A2L2YJL5_PARTP